MAVTVPGRRNNFHKNLEKKVSEFLISQCHWPTLGGAGEGRSERDYSQESLILTGHT